MNLTKHVVKVRTVQMAAFDGAKIAGGTELTRDDFKKSRTARIRMYGTTTVGDKDQEVEVLITKRQDGVPEFMKLVDIIEREGTFECLGHIVEEEDILGEVHVYDTPRLKVELTDDKGNAAFKYVPKPAPLWAKEYGEWKTIPMDFGRDEEQSKSFAERRRATRLASRAARSKAAI
jgi:hypothetical protein